MCERGMTMTNVLVSPTIFFLLFFFALIIDREQSTLIEGDVPLVHKDRRSLSNSTYVDAAATGVLLSTELNQLKISSVKASDCNYENVQLQATAFYGNEWPS